MAPSKISLVNKENALRELETEGRSQWFVDSGVVLDVEKEHFLHVQIVNKYDSTSFLVRNVSSNNETVAENIELYLQNGFDANCKKALSKILLNTELIIMGGFEIKNNGKDIKTIFVDYNHEMLEIWILKSGFDDQHDFEDVLSEEYIYTKFRDLSAQNQVNLYGVVKRVDTIKALPANLFKVRLFLTDETIGFVDAVEFTVSSKSEKDLEAIKPNDIIRFHRVTIETFFGSNDIFRGSGRVGINGFHFLVFKDDGSRSVDDDFEPYSTGKRYTFTNKDKENVDFIRNWSGKFTDLDADLLTSLPLCRFTTPGDYQNLLVEVLAVGNVSSLHTECVLRVWDGSKICIQPLNVLGNFREVAQNVLDFDEQRNRIVNKLKLSVDVFVHDEHKESASKLKAGDVVKLVNVHAFKKVEPKVTAQALVMHGSQYSNAGKRFNRGVYLVNAENPLVEELKSKLNKLINDYAGEDGKDDGDDDDDDDESSNKDGASGSGSKPNLSTSKSSSSNVDNSKNREPFVEVVSDKNNAFVEPNADGNPPVNDQNDSESFITARSITDGGSPLLKRLKFNRPIDSIPEIVTGKILNDSPDSIQSEIYSQGEQMVKRIIGSKETVANFAQTNE